LKIEKKYILKNFCEIKIIFFQSKIKSTPANPPFIPPYEPPTAVPKYPSVIVPTGPIKESVIRSIYLPQC
jgi:hypothetical protein